MNLTSHTLTTRDSSTFIGAFSSWCNAPPLKAPRPLHDCAMCDTSLEKLASLISCVTCHTGLCGILFRSFLSVVSHHCAMYDTSLRKIASFISRVTCHTLHSHVALHSREGPVSCMIVLCATRHSKDIFRHLVSVVLHIAVQSSTSHSRNMHSNVRHVSDVTRKTFKC